MAGPKKKSKLAPKTHHFYAILLFIFGTLFPPLAVAARFGIGSDFWLNLLLTICGYIPGHGHNFYIQNIRNNKTHRRTPKWAQRYGLVDTTDLKRKERKSQWSNRYNERNAHSALEGAQYEEGQERPQSGVADNFGGPAQRRAQAENDLWNPSEEQFYGRSDAASSSSAGHGRWHYPINADDAEPASPDMSRAPPPSSGSRGKNDKKDRWARTEDAYAAQDTRAPRRKKSKRRSTDERSTSTAGFPEDAEGGLYGSGPARRTSSPSRDGPPPRSSGRRNGDDEFSHQF